MDTCEKYTDGQWLSYLLNRVGEEEMVEMQYHLSTCDACRERIERMRAFAGFLENPGEKEPSLFSSKIFRLASPLVKKRQWMVAAAMSLFLSAGAYYYWVTFPRQKSQMFPVEFREQPVYESVDTLRSVPDSLPAQKEKQKEKK